MIRAFLKINDPSVRQKIIDMVEQAWADPVAISASSPGRIEMLTVQEGEAVEKGALLYTLDLDTNTKDGGAQRRIIDAQTSERAMLIQETQRENRMSETLIVDGQPHRLTRGY